MTEGMGAGIKQIAASALSTNRFDLKRPSQDDFTFLCQLYSDPDVMRYISTGVRDVEKTKSSLEKFIKHWEDHGFGMWVLHSKTNHEKLGYMGFRILEGVEGIEFGGLLLKKIWGQGVATEVGETCLNHGFSDCGFKYIYSVVDPGNKASLNWIAKLGMKRNSEKDGMYHESFVHYFCMTPEQLK